MGFFRKYRKKIHVILAILLALGLVGGSVAGLAHFLTAPRQDESGITEQELFDYWEEREQELLDSLAEKPTDLEINLNLAKLYYEKGNYFLYNEEHQPEAKEMLLKAQQYFDKSLEIEPDLPQARFHKALISLSLGEVEQAGQELEKLTIDYPEENLFRFYYGWYLFSVKSDYEKAIGEWETLLANKPEDPRLEEETRYWLEKAQELLDSED
ncbi:MAG: hypothetical protein GX767_07555 [Firmicutes bacterium]|nr:hypothetical protein [Bacillota bacterium]